MDQGRHREGDRGERSRLNVKVSEIKTMRGGTPFKLHPDWNTENFRNLLKVNEETEPRIGL